MIRWVHYAEQVGGGTKHTLGFKAFGRYLIITWILD